MEIPVPETGHRSFERALKSIRLGEVVGPAQITKFVAPRTRTVDINGLFGLTHPRGELQEKDLAEARTLFLYPEWVARVVRGNAVFENQEARVFQFQYQADGDPFVFGIFVTDAQFNLIDFCLDSRLQDRRRRVIKVLIGAVCTHASVVTRMH